MVPEPCWDWVGGFGIEGPLGIGFLNEVYCDIIASMKFRLGVCGHCGSIMVRMLILIWKS